MPHTNLIDLYLKTLQSPKSRYYLLAFTLIYIISPIDLIPDIIFPFGIIDDSILIVLLIYGVIVSIIEQLKDKTKHKK